MLINKLSRIPTILHNLWSFFCINYPEKKKLGKCGKGTKIEYPVYFQSPESIFIEDYCQIRRGCTIINSPNERVIIKKYSLLSINATIVSQNHVSTVGIPIVLLAPSHINDKRNDLIIEEDVWLGANVTLITGAKLGRGCIVAAGALVNKEVPPYAVVAGIPARIIAVKFSKEQILQHESVLYQEEERFNKSEIDSLFDNYFIGQKVYGLQSDLTNYSDLLNKVQGADIFIKY